MKLHELLVKPFGTSGTLDGTFFLHFL